jgi:hypothetical protein
MSMFPLDSIGRWLIVAGVVLAGVGLLFLLAGRIPGLERFGSLPGDIRYTSPDGRLSCFVPLVSMLLLSIILSVVLNIVIRLLNR